MVCIPCIVIPVLLVAYRKLLHPLVLRFMALWRMSTESRFAVKLAMCLSALMWRPPDETPPPPSASSQEQTAKPPDNASPNADVGLKSDDPIKNEASDLEAIRRRPAIAASS